MERILELPDLQHAWLPFCFCVVPRTNHLLRQVLPLLEQAIAIGFDNLTDAGPPELLQLQGDEALPPRSLGWACPVAMRFRTLLIGPVGPIRWQVSKSVSQPW